MIRTTNSIQKANLITHGGVFHADDVMATVILEKVFGDVTVCRVLEVPEKLNSNVIVYDIGGGKWDQKKWKQDWSTICSSRSYLERFWI